MTDDDKLVADMEAVHADLQAIWDRFLAIHARLQGMRGPVDTAFALGEATGVTSRAKALVGRDIDDMNAVRKRAEAAGGDDAGQA